MGYSERVCQLCGISFNIARMRKPDEPESDAWGSTGDGWVSHHYDGYPASLHDGRHDATCRDIRRGEPAPGLERDMWHFEHVPGPSCAAAPEGYSGWRIGAEEMREQTKIQCLVAKEQGWRPEPGDEDFEVDAKECFVTGIAGRVDEFDAYGFNPVKHGVESSLINSTDDDDTDEPWGLPMHPSCFYIFRRMSTARFSRIDIDGLWHLRTAQGGYPRFDHFPEREDVQLVGEQWYSHVPGTEYLAANPVEVPALGELIQNCTKTASDVVFDARPESSPHRDPFVGLSSELRMMLLPLLERKDVANLRSASKSFSQLPQSYFRHLGQQMDWFALWTGLSAADGADCADEKERFATSGLLDTIAEKGVTERPKEIRGLRNRRMIYRDIKIILSGIAKLTPEQRA